ncbi:hypothetical protein K1719_008940 [Acacia pycnantha]|nr:hypothetical protein K1719_008940 [Acacia pycnantha]
MDDFKGTEVIGVSNGLICLASNIPFKFIPWNPTIRKYVWLPLKMDWEDLSYLGKPNVYFNGIIHWIAHNREINCGVILTFDLSHEIFGQILLPEDARRHCRLNSVATTVDLLLFTQLSLLQNEYDNEFSDGRFDTWTMKQYGNHESWTKTSSLMMKIEMGPKHVLGARKNGDLILEMEEGQIYRYNPKKSNRCPLSGYYRKQCFLSLSHREPLFT